MADILLTHGYFLWEDEKEQQIMRPYPPLGLLYLSAYLKRAGFSVSVYDSTLGNRSELFERLAAEPGGVLGIYTNLITRRNVLAITQFAKEHGWTVILGGSEAINYPNEYLSQGADVIVYGEGEETLADLLPALADVGTHRLDGVAGVSFRDEHGRVVTTSARPQIAAIDTLPWPDRGQVDIAGYMSLWREHHGYGSINLITARGCPYKCRWCSRAVFGATHRRRDFRDCVDEVEMIRDTYRPEQVWYADDVFTINHKWLYNYAAEMKRRDLHLPFETISRADRMMDEKVLATLADMGCYRIWIGSESGSQRIFDAMERKVTLEQIQWVTSAAHRHGIEVGMFLMFGYDGETLDDIEATVEHVKVTQPDVFFTTVCYPVRDTKFYAAVEDRLRPVNSWANGTDRELRVAGRHSRAYYKQADLWLRREVEGRRTEASDARAGLLALAHEVEA